MERPFPLTTTITTTSTKSTRSTAATSASTPALNDGGCWGRGLADLEFFTISKRSALLALLSIILLAAALRCVRLDIAPPGMNVDEAGNMWNAWCLYKTGKDMHGVSWPVFRLRTFGAVDNRSTPFVYYLIPFLAAGGLSLQWARLAMAVSGVLTLLLLYYFTEKMYGRGAALVAAAMLALLPWHIRQSRWAQEGAFQPFLTAIPVAAMAWARLPIFGRRDQEPSAGRSLAAGLATGICCYGYFSLRIFIPLFLTVAVVVNGRSWLELLRSQSGRKAVAGFALGVALTFGPLVWKHLTDPDMNGRGRVTLGSLANDPLAVQAGKILGRYLPHFGPSFLFTRGDRDPFHEGPAGFGILSWYHLPLLLAGIAVLAAGWRRSEAGRFALLWLLLYPIGDLLADHPGSNVMRSQAGMLGLVLVCTTGVVVPLQWLRRRNRHAAAVSAAFLALAALSMTGLYLHALFGPYNRQPGITVYNEVDVLRALDWLKTSGGEYGRVFITAGGGPHPFIYTLVRTGMSPEEWFKAEKVVRIGPTSNGAHPHEDVYYRMGRYRFMYDNDWLDELLALSRDGRREKVLLVMEPVRIRLDPGRARVVTEFRRADGRVVLQAVELSI